MWNRRLSDDKTYILDLIQEEDGWRRVVPRPLHESLHPRTVYYSLPYTGHELTAALKQGEIGDYIKLTNDRGFKSGAHGEWMTEDEFALWKEHLRLHCQQIRKKK